MRAAHEIARLRESIWLWQAYDPAVKAELFSTAIKVANGIFLVDPIPLAPRCLQELIASAEISGILVTNLNHPRAAEDFTRQFDAPIFAAESVAGEFQTNAITSVADGETISPGVSAIALCGAVLGEIAFYFPGDGGTMVIGDALINFGSHDFGFLPAKYCIDQKEMRRSLRRLLDWPFERLLFAHGNPILVSARARLEMLLS